MPSRGWRSRALAPHPRDLRHDRAAAARAIFIPQEGSLDATLITNCLLVDGTGARPREGAAVLVSGNRIQRVGALQEVQRAARDVGTVEEIDATGKTVIPGLIDSHAHLNFFRPRNTLEIDGVWPAQYMGIVAMSNAQKVLAAGYTGIIGGGSQFTLDVWVKRAIRAGLFRGPRVVSASRGLSVTGGDGDWFPSWLGMQMETMVALADGPDDVRRLARKLLKEGSDALKIFPSGENSRVEEFHPQMYDCPADRDCMRAEEIEAAADEAHRWGKMVIAHARGDAAVRTCIRVGVDIILHATLITDETVDAMAKLPPLAVVPALMPNRLFVQASKAGAINRDYAEKTGYAHEFELACANMKKLHKAGIRVLPGGEYGLFQMPFHGENAKDLELFVSDLGFTPHEAICAATRDAAHAMKMEKELGTLEVGKLADLVIVDGNPLEDIRVLQDLKKIEVVMKDGIIEARQGKVLPA